MGKMFNTMILGTFIIVVLGLFNGLGNTPSSLVLLLMNPSAWEGNAFWLIFSSAVTIGGGITLGLAAVLRQDWIARAGAVGLLSSIVVAPFVDLFTFVVAQTNYISLGCVNSPICTRVDAIGGLGQFIGILLIAPLLLYALWACVEWIWKGDSF
jgi:hypothetical protein